MLINNFVKVYHKLARTELINYTKCSACIKAKWKILCFNEQKAQFLLIVATGTRQKQHFLATEVICTDSVRG